MSGIYGDLLLAFPEQMRSVTVYEMEPRINGGWDRTANTDRTIRGIYQNTSGNQIKDSNGNLVKSGGLELWTSADDLNGFFTTLKNNVYRLNSVTEWTTEGGYARYRLEKLVGNNGTDDVDTTWNSGTNNFY